MDTVISQVPSRSRSLDLNMLWNRSVAAWPLKLNVLLREPNWKQEMGRVADRKRCNAYRIAHEERAEGVRGKQECQARAFVSTVLDT